MFFTESFFHLVEILIILPAFLKEYKSELEKYKLDSVRIHAKPLKKGSRLPIKTSKFLGKPFLPISQEYPRNKFGRPMVMLAQINFEEMPRLKNYPAKGIFQVFTSTMFWDIGNEYYVYFYHRNINAPYHKDFSFLTSDLYEGLPINCEHKLTFSKEIEYGSTRDFRFDFDSKKTLFKDFKEMLPNKELDKFNELFYSGGHKIGGYAYFTQADPRHYDTNKKDDVLLLQIDTDEEIMFGDAGISNIFINLEDLKKKRFEKAYFNWDCA